MSFLSFMLGDTGDFLTVHDPKDRAGQAAWQRATDVSIQLTRKPSMALTSKLVAYVGVRSSMGDPTKPGWLEGLPAAQRVKTAEEMLQLAVAWHLEQGRNADGSSSDAVAAAQSKAAALALAATQAGPQRGELLAKAAIAERRATDLAKAARSSRRATGRASGRGRTWGDLAISQRWNIGPTASQRALAKASVAATRPATSDDLPAPDFLWKRRRGAG